MFKKLRLWLFPTTVEGFTFDPVDRDGDGIVQEGTPFERKLVNSVAKAKKKPVKKTVAKKKPAPKKKAPSKKTTAKKPVKKTQKKK